MQIADGDSVYLIDVSKLKKSMDILKWNGFFELFFHPDRIRIGFDVNNDLKFLQSTFPFLKELISEKKPKLVDLKKLTECVFNNSSIKKLIFNDEIPPTISLENLVKYICKIPLTKEERAGNWESRPLRREQLIYASRDAHFLIVIYNNLVNTITHFLPENESKDFIEGGTVVTMGQSQNSIQLIAQKKSNFSDILVSIKDVNSKVSNTFVEGNKNNNPEDIIIVVDTPILKIVPVLRRCGYHTFDYREKAGEVTVKAACMNQILSEYISENINKNLYFLSNRFLVSLSNSNNFYTFPFSSRWRNFPEF